MGGVRDWGREVWGGVVGSGTQKSCTCVFLLLNNLQGEG